MERLFRKILGNFTRKKTKGFRNNCATVKPHKSFDFGEGFKYAARILADSKDREKTQIELEEKLYESIQYVDFGYFEKGVLSFLLYSKRVERENQNDNRNS